MPTTYVDPTDCLVLRQMDRLRELVTDDADLPADLWNGAIRPFPTDPPTEAEGALCAIFAESWNFASAGAVNRGKPGSTLGGVGVRKVSTSPRIVIDVKVREPEGGANHEDLYRQTLNTLSAVLSIVEKYRRDPTQGLNASLWSSIEFPAEPVVTIQRLPQVGYQATAIVVLNSQHTNP